MKRPHLRVIEGSRERLEDAAVNALMAGRTAEFVRIAAGLQRRAALTAVNGLDKIRKIA